MSDSPNQLVDEYDRRVESPQPSVLAGICEHVVGNIESVILIESEDSDENATDVNTNQDGESCKNKCCKESIRGGARNTLNASQKAACAEEDNVREFLEDCRCFCGESCLEKIFQLGEEGENIIKQLREDRFAGTHGCSMASYLTKSA